MKIARLRNADEVPMALAAMVTLSLQSLLAETQPRQDATKEDAAIALTKEMASCDANEIARDLRYEMGSSPARSSPAWGCSEQTGG